MKGSIKLGKIFGIPLNINYTWFVIIALVTISFATVTYPGQFADWSTGLYWAAGLATALLLFVSVLLHELAHSLVSIARGTPVEGITLFIFGGVSSITEELKKPLDELLMAAAGPAVSLVLGVVLGIVALLSPSADSFGIALARTLAIMNLGLAIFNMIPGFPLDGGRVLRALIWWGSKNMHLATRVASIIGRGIATFMIVGGLLVAVFTGDWGSGLWLAFIGWFLENAAGQSYSQFVLREMLAGITARDLLNDRCPAITDDPTLQTLIDQQVLGEGRRCLLLTRGDALAGMVTLHNIKNVPREQWGATRASQVMTPVGELKTVDIDDSALDVLRRMDVEDVNQIPVIDSGRLVGLISRDAVLRFIRQRAEMGP